MLKIVLGLLFVLSESDAGSYGIICCMQVASEHIPRGANEFVTIAYVPLKGDQ